jgi:hypothetical protein
MTARIGWRQLMFAADDPVAKMKKKVVPRPIACDRVG